jgi:S1-C subfamily serine protease
MKKLLLASAATVAFGVGTAAAGTATASRPAVGPSFNCAAAAVANQPLAQLICSSDRIARAELGYVIAYMALRQISNDAEQAANRAEADAFTVRITDECGIPRTGKLGGRPAFELEVNCLVGKFDEERSRLFKRLSGDAMDEAWLTPEQTVAIQRLLKEKGYLPTNALLDGVFGQATREAIGNWQRSNGQPSTGFGSAALLAELQRPAPAATPAPPTGTSLPQASAKPKAAVDAGTGFYVGKQTIITNHHVINDCSEIRIRKSGVEVGKASLIAASSGDDLAALHSDRASDTVLKLRVGVPLRPAEAVVVFGYPLVGALSSSGNTTLGNITALTGLGDDSRLIQISASVQPGNSGGPVLDEVGRLVGVVEGKLNALKVLRATGDIPQNVNFAIRASTLTNFLEANRVAYEVESGSTVVPNIELADRAERASVALECWK